MRPTLRRFLWCALLAGTLSACDRGAASRESHRPAPEFGTFTSSLFAELRSLPLGESIDTEIGLFGDLHVMSGENVVMGRYRYRVDSATHGVSGHMSFHVRLAQSLEAAVPVVLAFEDHRGSWKLADARYQVPESTPDVRDALRDAFDDHFDEWISSAVREAGAD